MRTLLLALLCLLPDGLHSCGPDYSTGEDYRFWLLQPEIADTRALHAFYFTTDVLYGPDYDQLVSLPYAANLAEWQAVVGPVPADTIAAILYGTAPEDYFKQEAELFRTNAFLRTLAQKKNGWPAYIGYAKRCEQLVNSSDPWGFIAHDGQGIRKAWNEGLKQLRAAKEPPLRARLAFQLVRLAHHGQDPGRPDLDAQGLYDRYLAPLRGSSWMEPAAAFYLAGMRNNPQRDLAFAACFDRATDKQFRMVQLFESGQVESYLPLATSDAQRATLLVMRDLQHPGRALDDLERIAAWDPGNAHLPLLLTRETNKLEDRLLTPALTDFHAAIDQWNEREDGLTPEDVSRANRQYLYQVQAFITRIAPHYTGPQQALLQLLHGHLSFIVGDLDACRATLARVEQDPAATAMMRAQARIDRILCGVLAAEQLSDATRSDVLALVELMNTEPALSPHRALLLGQLHLYLGKELMQRGELAEGLFLLARTGRQFGRASPLYWHGRNARHEAFQRATPADYDRMIALLDKPDKTAFERYLTATDERPADWEGTEAHFRNTELSREKLLDHKATWYLVRDRLDEAAAAFRQIPDAFWTGYPYAMFAADDPFQLNLHDPHNYGKTDVGRYNKRTIVERMIVLKKQTRDPKQRALSHYLLGNAYYNMSWHGKYWIMSRLGWSMWEMDQWRDRETTDFGDDDYFGCARAKEHYLLALQAARDPVLKALAVDMAGTCERNWLDYAGEGGLDEWTNPYRHALTDAKSEAALRDIEDCRGYADMVARYR